MSTSFPLTLGGQQLLLHPDLSLQLDADRLMIADVHIGKTMHFRKNGLGVPERLAQEELDQLSRLVDRHQPRELFVLGDLFHAQPNSEWDRLEKWLDRQKSLSMKLIKGNHDRHAHLFVHDRFELMDQVDFHGLRLCHEPSEAPGGQIEICGHLHPTYLLKGQGKQSLKLPCFYLRKNQFILPAFGRFTGGWKIQPQSGERIFLSTGRKVEALSL